MTDSPLAHVRDPQRLAVLRGTGLLDSPPEEAFDRFARLACDLLRAPVALVTLVDADRQFFKACVGLPEPWATWRQTPLSHAFCQHVASGEPLVVENARAHPLLRDNLAIPDLGVVAYLGMPLALSDGQALGSFCVIDSRPRAWEAHQVALMRALAAAVVGEIELRLLVREAERQRENLQFQATILANITETSVIVTGLDGKITYWNAGATAIFGYTAEEMLGRTPARLYPEQDPAELTAHLAAVLEGRDFAGEWRGRRKDGSPVWVDIRTTVMRDTRGAASGFVGVARDVTERKQAEEERARLLEREQVARAQAESALGARDAFLASLSHDLRNPLSAIRGHAQLLQRQGRRAEPPELSGRLMGGAGTVVALATKMAALIDELVDVSRLRMGERLELRQDPTDLVALARGAVAQHAPASGRHQVRLEAPLPRLVGRWDAGRLDRVLDNLLSNAIKYSPAGGEVVLRVRREGAWAVLQVADRGLGIPAAHLPHLFEPFRRGGNVEGRLAGTGLGLWGVRRITEQHGGDIRVESTEGAGTTVTVRLPLEHGPEAEPGTHA